MVRMLFLLILQHCILSSQTKLNCSFEWTVHSVSFILTVLFQNIDTTALSGLFSKLAKSINRSILCSCENATSAGFQVRCQLLKFASRNFWHARVSKCKKNGHADVNNNYNILQISGIKGDDTQIIVWRLEVYNTFLGLSLLKKVNKLVIFSM